MYLSALFTRFQALPKQLFPFSNKLFTIVQSKPLSSIPKRTLGANDINEQLRNKTKIELNISSNSFTTVQCINQNEKADFIVDEDGYIRVWIVRYTYGACNSNRSKNTPTRIGVWFGKNHPLNFSIPVGRGTRSVAEIRATAVRQAKKAGIKKLRFNIDSEFSMESLELDSKTMNNIPRAPKICLNKCLNQEETFYRKDFIVNKDEDGNVSAAEVRRLNNVAKIIAVIIAARQAKKAGIKKVSISSNSECLFSYIMQWKPKWKKTGWKTEDGNPIIEYEKDLLEMEKELKFFSSIEWDFTRYVIHCLEKNEKLD